MNYAYLIISNKITIKRDYKMEETNTEAQIQNVVGGITDRLSKKIDSLLTKYHEMQDENKSLKNENTKLNEELESVKSTNDVQFRKLEEDLAMKDLEVEDILSKIEEAISR